MTSCNRWRSFVAALLGGLLLAPAVAQAQARVVEPRAGGTPCAMVAMQADDPATVAGPAAELGATVRALPMAGWYLLRFGSVADAQAATAALRDVAGVQEIRLQCSYPVSLRTDDPLFSNQWHLENTGQSGGTSGEDINVVPVWTAGITGAGVRLAVLDTGVDSGHPDLAGNFNASRSFDYLNDDAVPEDTDGHGTACAGLAAAVANNDEGVAGVAYDAELVGLAIGPFLIDAVDAAALGHQTSAIDIYSNSWGPTDGAQYFAIQPLAAAAIAQGAAEGRDGLGCVYLWAAGNGADLTDNANYDGYANNPDVLAIGTVDHDGVIAFYSEPGACLVACTPADGVTTTLIGDTYTASFDGTSAATPIAAGVVALMLEANPHLGYRDVLHVLARTGRQVQPGDAGWQTNGAGLTHHHHYGFGVIDAEAAVALAQGWPPAGARVTVTADADTTPLAITDDDAGGTDRQVVVSASISVEHAVVDIDLDHAAWGEVVFTLTSPAGTVSELSLASDVDGPDGGTAWTYTSVACLGEASAGTWTLNVADVVGGTTGTLNSWQLTLLGTDDEPGTPGTVALAAANPPDDVIAVSAEQTLVTGATATVSGGSVLLQTITLEASGTTDPADDIGEVSVWHDLNGNGTLESDEDDLLGTGNFDGAGEVVLGLGLALGDGESATLLVAVELTGEGTAGETLTVGVADLQQIGSNAGLPVAGSAATVIAELTLGTDNPGDTTVSPGQTRAWLATVVATAVGGPVLLDAVELAGSGSIDESSGIGTVFLLADTNGDGQPGESDTEPGTGSFAANDSSLNLDVAETVEPGNPLRLFILCDLTASASDGETVMLSIADATISEGLLLGPPLASAELTVDVPATEPAGDDNGHAAGQATWLLAVAVLLLLLLIPARLPRRFAV